MPSRIAKNPIKIPAGVDVKLAGLNINIKGKLGELSEVLPPQIKIDQTEGQLRVTATNDSKESDALSGTARALIDNMVTGVSEGFVKKLVLKGVGYRAKIQGNGLDLSVGFSHPLVIPTPKGITIETPSNTEIFVKGADKQLVCQVAANIRAVRPPEPYKGKGIRYENESVILKEGKKK